MKYGSSVLKKRDSKTQPSAEFANFARTLRNLANVPKKEVEIEEVRWRAARLKKKKPAT
jgi:hypothetical protein